MESKIHTHSFSEGEFREIIVSEGDWRCWSRLGMDKIPCSFRFRLSRSLTIYRVVQSKKPQTIFLPHQGGGLLHGTSHSRMFAGPRILSELVPRF